MKFAIQQMGTLLYLDAQDQWSADRTAAVLFDEPSEAIDRCAIHAPQKGKVIFILDEWDWRRSYF